MYVFRFAIAGTIVFISGLKIVFFSKIIDKNLVFARIKKEYFQP